MAKKKILKDGEVSKIDKLTKLQENQLVTHRQEYLDWGLCTKPLNRELMERGISGIYETLLGNRKVNYFWVCESPLMCNLVISFLRSQGFNKKNLRTDLRTNLQTDLQMNIQTNLWTNIRMNLPEAEVAKS